MNIEKIKFNEKPSQRIYQDYLKRIDRVTKGLPKKDQKEVLMEFNSHIYEGLQQNINTNEIDRLLDILEKLGSPEEVLKPLIADKKMEQATRTFNPLHMVKALALNVTNGISYVIFFVLYLMLFGFVFLIYSKLTNPVETGLFFDGNHFQALGRINPGYIKGTQIHEVLGQWFIPVMLLSLIVFYLLITLLLRLKRIINKK